MGYLKTYIMKINTEKIADMSDADLLAWERYYTYTKEVLELTSHEERLWFRAINVELRRRIKTHFEQLKPFIFTDWLASLGFVYIGRHWINGNISVFLYTTTFSVTEQKAINVFEHANVPASVQQAEFLFQSFNLLECEK